MQSIWLPTVGENAEDNLKNLPIPKIPSPWLRNGAHSKDSQPDSPFSLGRTEGSASVKSYNHSARFGIKLPFVYQLYGCLSYIERLKKLLLYQGTSLTTVNYPLFCLYGSCLP